MGRNHLGTAFAGILALVTAGLIFSARSVQAAAVTISSESCSVFAGPDCTSFVALEKAEITFHASNSGNQLVTCKGTLPAGFPLPTSAQECNFANTGAECITLGGGSTDWKAITQPSGHVSFSCNLHK
jgi:hypothetical protein